MVFRCLIWKRVKRESNDMKQEEKKREREGKKEDMEDPCREVRTNC